MDDREFAVKKKITIDKGIRTDMIATITLNPCVDKTLCIRGFYFGGMNRVERHRADVSGKGINVSIALKQMEREVMTFGFSYENGNEMLNRAMRGYGIDYRSVLVPGTLRENMKVMDEERAVTTELNQKGEYVPEEKLEEFERLLDRYLDEIDILVVTGSVPEGVPADYYEHLIAKASRRNIRTILDAEGELFLNGLKSKPYLIKPNLYEFKSAFGVKGSDMAELIRVCRKIIDDGVKVICLSMGDKGAVIVDKNDAYICRPTQIEVKSTQGAGDSLVAGICAAMEEGRGLEDMLKYGVAAAQGSLIKEGTLLCGLEEFEHFKSEVTVERLK